MTRQSAIGRALTEWYGLGHRDLPWRRTRDPYRIWVSEIMLQQTRAATVIPYYERFLARFPTVDVLAASEEAEVLTLWSGLGYYSRARSLRQAAGRIVAQGGFPRDSSGWKALPGVGEYTAAAVASIAFGEPIAVLDGNVLRVAARMENDAADIAAGRTRRRFREIVQAWLPPQDAGAFNQALMELGATVCTPRNPQCPLCPVSAWCRARATGTVGELPVKLRAAAPLPVTLEVLIVRRGGRLLLRQRGPEESRLAGFWELPSPSDLPEAEPGETIGEVRHSITNHRYTVVARVAKWPEGPAPGGFGWFRTAELAAIPLTTISKKCLELLRRNAAPGRFHPSRVEKL